LKEPPKQGPFVVSTTSTSEKAPVFETVSTTILRDPGQQLGMSMLHTNEVNPNRSPLRIEFIAMDGPIKRDGKLRIGDELLSINGINLKGMRFDDALAMLQNASTTSNELHLVVQRVSGGRTSWNESKNTQYINDLHGDRIVDGSIDEVELSRDERGALGLSIVGGIDHACQPFAFDHPGVFISKITSNSPAARSRKLRIGDRILAVNGRDISKAKHADAVNELKNSGNVLRLKVCHEPQPRGLQEVFIKRRPG
jgi:protein scribble